MKKLISYILFAFYCLTVFAQTPYKKPALENKNSWSLIMIPDLQNYAKWSQNQPLMELMTAWIEDNIDSLNIRMVMCVGDLIQNNEKLATDYDGNRSTQNQWEAVSRAFAKLDGKVPYIAATGNHDYSIDREGRRTSRYNEFFTIDRNHLNHKTLVQNTRSEDGQQTLENAAYEIKDLHGKDYLFMTVEFGPRDTVITWAKKVAALEQYKNHRIILMTHSYINNKDQHIDAPVRWIYWEPYNINNMIQKAPHVTMPFANSGKQIWDKLVRPATNIELVLSGHIAGEGYRKDKNTAGKEVHQVLFDAQSMGGGSRSGNGGDGWLRILEFLPDGKTVKIKTFSPLFAISPTSQQHAYKTDARNEFTIRFSD